MKKFITLIIVLAVVVATCFIIVKKDVSISFEKNNYHNQEVFDALDINISNFSDDMVIEVYGLDLVGFTSDEIKNKSGYLKEFGLYTLTYKIYLNDELLNVSYRELNIYVYNSDLSNLIINNDFNANLYKWIITDNTSGLSSSVINNVLNINQLNTGDYFWDQKLSQYVDLEYNQAYELSFDLYSTTSKQIEVSIYQGLHDNPWSYNYGLLEYINISTINTTYTYNFTFTQPNYIPGFPIDKNNVLFEFKFGKNEALNNIESTLYFSNIKLVKVTS